ncbi:MAG: hypothetical protein OEM91_09790, partial [Hyphomicrobiales bacterium]|nr:hypothetical protein [Hyphomicrobiales bacterium]
DIEIVARELTKARARACRKGTSYKVVVSPSGRIHSQTPFGSACRQHVNVARATENVRRKGYRNVAMEQMPNGAYTGTGCQKNTRYRITLNSSGIFSEVVPIGRCNQLLRPKEIAALLRAQGFNRISFVNKQPPHYVAQACFEDRRMELVLTGNGKIWRDQPIGRCDPPINPRRIADVLRAKGFTRVAVVDDVLPRYVARGCRKNRRIEVVLNRYGEIRDKREIGPCSRPMSRDQLANKLRDEGYRRIRFIDGAIGSFVVEACFEGNRFQINVSQYGETQHERELGPCKTPRVDQLLADIENKGLSDVRLFAIGCRKGNKVRLELDGFGTTVDAKRVGRCR